MNNVSVRHLRAFIEVASCGSFTKAAHNLHLTQSTLTATIKQLEEQAGLKLLDRTTRSVLLTGEGAGFLPVAEKLISDFDTAFSDLQAVATHQRGKVGIAASPSMIGRVLPDIIKSYHQQYPKIGIYLRDDNASGIEQRVLDNDVDFGIGGNHSAQSELNYKPVLNDLYGVVLPHNHPLRKQNIIEWKDICELPQVHLTSDSGTRSQLLKLVESEHLNLNLQGSIIEVSTPAGLAEMVHAGIGISLLPALAASTRAFQHLVFIPLKSPTLNREICIISRKGRALSPAAESLLSMIEQQFKRANLPRHVERIN